MTHIVRRKWRWPGLVAKIALTGLLLMFILHNEADTAALLDRVTRVSPWTMTGVILLILGQALFNAFRWRAITGLVGPKLSGRNAVNYVLVGLFFNQTLPSAVGGDIVRWWYARRSGIPALPAFNGLFLDRVIGMLVLLLFVLAMVPVVSTDQPIMPLWVVFALFSGMALGFVAMLLMDRLPERWARTRYFDVFVLLAGDARRVFLCPTWTPPLLALSAAAQILVILAVYLLAASLNTQASFAQCLFVVPAALLFAALPVSFGGWGVREGAFIVGFGLFGVPSADALSVSVLFGLGSLLAGFPGGIIWWLALGGGDVQGNMRDEPPDSLPVRQQGGKHA